ncbi:MAG: tetratricopeptide repeat protein, partial [Methanophagales archaeon]|nr:tetratricopeptide repeat protein [Methanophagales archaeon]
INGLVDWRLISYDKTKKTYTSHPLIKGYCESNFDEKDKKLCHKRIYQYFGEYAPEQPETLEEMQPLFEQVYHGCAAGLYDEVFNDIYRGKIQRWDEYYLVLKLGAWGTDLDLVLNFFPLGDTSRMPLVSERSSQLELISEACTALLCIGKPTPAESLIMRAIKMSIKDGDYKNASISYRTLAENQFRIGEVIKAQESAKYAVKMATAKHMPRQQVRSTSFLAYTLLLSGEIEKAGQLFKEANNIQREIEADANILYSIEGVFYADFLTILGRYDEAFKINTKNLEICTNQKKLIAEVSRCLRSLGGLERIKENHDKANEHLNNALDIARRIGIPDLEIEALIERGRVRLDTKDYDDAVVDSSAVLKLCERTGFKLYEPEAEIVLSEVYLALNDLEQAKIFAHSAYEKAISMHYRWPEGDAAHLLGEIYLAMGDKVRAR